MNMVTMYQSDKRCPNCKLLMNSDGRTYYCPGCGVEIQRIKHLKKPKKWAYRTARNIREEQ
jgi:tRNA(Ile2) C34 agmatinyltransferase TiaS